MNYIMGPLRREIAQIEILHPFTSVDGEPAFLEFQIYRVEC